MSLRFFRRCFPVVALIVFSSSPSVFGQLNFNISSTGNANADAGFQRAADFWSSIFSDNITVNIDAEFIPLTAGTAGGATSIPESFSYGAVRDALIADQSSALDAQFVSGLASGDSFDVYINRTADFPASNISGATPFVAQQDSLVLTRANAKALGLIDANSTATDTSIAFNSDIAFDFDPSDGIAAGQSDFTGTAIHEIGHALGFISGVDILENFLTTNLRAPTVEEAEFGTVLDLTRHSDDSFAAGANFDLTSDTRAKYISFDGGTTTGAPGRDHFARGALFGSDFQASHFRDESDLPPGTLPLGALDPVLPPPGFASIFTELDTQAFDVIGFNRISAVPEPSMAWLLAFVAFAGSVNRRRSA